MDEKDLSRGTLHKSRVDLFRGLGEISKELVSLGWKAQDGLATREMVLSIAELTAEIQMRNSHDILMAMQSKNELHS